MPSLDSLIDQVLRTASQVGNDRRTYRNRLLEDEKNKWQSDIAARERIASMQHGQGGSADRNLLAQERIQGMQYGPGGASDRTAASALQGQTLHYGPGGAMDRSSADTLAASNYATDAQRPQWEGLGKKYTADARQGNLSADYDEDMNPFRAAEERAQLKFKEAVADKGFAKVNPPIATPIATPKATNYAPWLKEALASGMPPGQVTTPYKERIKGIKQWRPTGFRPADSLAQMSKYMFDTSLAVPGKIYDYLTYK